MKNLFTVGLLVFIISSGCSLKRKTLSHSIWQSEATKSGSSQIGSPQDPSLRFVGRWDFSDKAIPVSYWGGAYIKTEFYGTTVKLSVGHPTNFFVKIDNSEWVSFKNVKDTVTLTPVALAAGWHKLTVAQGKDYDYIFQFKGLIFDQDAKTRPPQVSPVLVEYIGDSITTGYTDSQANVSDYGWVASEILGTEHTQIAYPGINLASGYGKSKGNGMDIQYLKARSLKYPDAAEWTFEKYSPDVVTINLGTNDNNNKVPDSVFTQSYIKLITSIRSHFPKAKIIAMRTFLGIKQAATMEAVNQLNAHGDRNVFYLDTTGWITSKTSDYNDSAHPSDAGQVKAGKLLAEKLKPFLP